VRTVLEGLGGILVDSGNDSSVWKIRETKGREARNDAPEFRSSNVKYVPIRRVFRTASGDAPVQMQKRIQYQMRTDDTK